ncbi:MAG: hypothetical protein AAF840_15245, partial [Bacteroidota bacterium]
MKVLQLSLFSLVLLLSTGLAAQGTPVPATDDTENTETTDLTIEELSAGDSMEKKKMNAGGKTGTLTEFGIRPSYMF